MSCRKRSPKTSNVTINHIKLRCVRRIYILSGCNNIKYFSITRAICSCIIIFYTPHHQKIRINIGRIRENI